MYAEIMTADGFSNPWYWLLVAIVWVRSIQTTLGIPGDVMRNAKTGDPQAKADALHLLDIHIRNTTDEFNHFGAYLVATMTFVLASIATMGFWNDVAVLQGAFFIAFPMALIGALGIRLASKLKDQEITWDQLCGIYRRHFWLKFAMGVLFIFTSMLWAVYLEIRPYLEHF
jgi:hypothetical protein